MPSHDSCTQSRRRWTCSSSCVCCLSSYRSCLDFCVKRHGKLPSSHNLGSTLGSFDYIRVLKSDGNVCTGRSEECRNPAPITDVNNVQLDIAMPDGCTCYGTVAKCLSECALDQFDTKTWESSGAKALLANWIKEKGFGNVQFRSFSPI
jgi:hypothetical protein